MNSRLSNIDTKIYSPEETAVIILGDMGLNFYLNNSDTKNKQAVNDTHFHIYAVHGNHEARASDITTIQWAYNKEVKGIIGTEPEFPNIHYFKDEVSEYTINGYKCLIVPGAFSVDGEYRRQKTLSNGWCGWFPEEQLSLQEMEEGIKLCSGKTYDFVLSHTCPISWMPRDLFLPTIDQSKVDYSMENYLEAVRRIIEFKVWLFGHYHDDRLERPWAQMFYYNFETLDDVYERVVHPRNEPDYYHKKSPNYYMEDN